MRYWMFIIAFLCCTEMFAQKYSVRNKSYDRDLMEVNDSARFNHLYMAGVYQQKEANLCLAAIGSGVAGTITGIIAANSGVKTTKDVLTGTSIFFGIASIGCTIWAINLKTKAGGELKLAAGKVVYKF